MATLTGIPEDKMKVIQQHIERIRNSTHMDSFKSMYAKMKLTFGEENIQIKKIDEDYIANTFNQYGWSLSMVARDNIDNLKLRLNNTCSKYELLIRFPEIIVSNGHNKTTIRDVFVKLLADPNGKLSPGMQGVVATFTKAQAMAGYLHSHLSSQDVRTRLPSFGAFCLGEGQITQVLTLLRTSYNEINFGMLCIHIKNFLEWESLDGVPYIKMSIIPHTGNTTQSIPALAAERMSTIARTLMNKFRELPVSEARSMVTLSADEMSIIVEPTDQLSKWAATAIGDHPGQFGELATSVPDVLAYRDSHGKYVACLTNTGGDIRPPAGTVLKFRGEDIKVKIIDNESNLNRVKYANPKIIEQFCIKLSEELTTRALEDAEARDSSPSDNIGQTTDANSNPVQQNTPA